MTLRIAKVTAPTRIDLAGGTLDIAPMAQILQEKMSLWNSEIITVNSAINLRASAEVQVELYESAVTLQHDNNANGFSSHSLEVSFEDKVSGKVLAPTKFTSHPQEFQKDFVLHTGILRALYPILLRKNVKNVKIVTNAMAPKGSGLGGSSSVVVCVLQALNVTLDFGWTVEKLCEIAKNIEAGILGSLAGNQDHIAAAMGGVLCVEHNCIGTNARRLKCNGEKLIGNLLLAYSNQQHFSAFNNWSILERFLTGQKDCYEKAFQIAKISQEIISPLRENDFLEVGRKLSEEWAVRKTWAPGISTPKLDEMFDAAMQAGAAGGKVCGAGGGGVLMMMCLDTASKTRARAAVQKAGGTLLDAEFSSQGMLLI